MERYYDDKIEYIILFCYFTDIVLKLYVRFGEVAFFIGCFLEIVDSYFFFLNS